MSSSSSSPCKVEIDLLEVRVEMADMKGMGPRLYTTPFFSPEGKGEALMIVPHPLHGEVIQHVNPVTVFQSLFNARIRVDPSVPEAQRNECAREWRICTVQNVIDTTRETWYTDYYYRLSMNTPCLDGEGTWFCGQFTHDGAFVEGFTSDTPGARMTPLWEPLNPEEAPSTNVLTKYIQHDKFKIWIFAENTKTKEIRYLYNATWSIDFRFNVTYADLGAGFWSFEIEPPLTDPLYQNEWSVDSGGMGTGGTTPNLTACVPSWEKITTP